MRRNLLALAAVALFLAPVWIAATARPAEPSCVTDSECAMTPECLADSECDGGPQKETDADGFIR